MARGGADRRGGDAVQQHVPASRAAQRDAHRRRLAAARAAHDARAPTTRRIWSRRCPGLAEQGPGPLYVPELPYLRAIWVVGGSERSWVTPVAFDAVDDTGISDELLAAVESEVSPADPAVVVYTSGSAAEPKAVVHTHGTVVRKTSTESISGSLGSYPGHRVLCAMPFFWVGGVQMLAGALHSGSAIVCQERFDAAGALDLIEREQVTTMLGWATTLSARSTRARATRPAT